MQAFVTDANSYIGCKHLYRVQTLTSSAGTLCVCLGHGTGDSVLGTLGLGTGDSGPKTIIDFLPILVPRLEPLRKNKAIINIGLKQRLLVRKLSFWQGIM